MKFVLPVALRETSRTKVTLWRRPYWPHRPCADYSRHKRHNLGDKFLIAASLVIDFASRRCPLSLLVALRYGTYGYSSTRRCPFSLLVAPECGRNLRRCMVALFYDAQWHQATTETSTEYITPGTAQWCAVASGSCEQSVTHDSGNGARVILTFCTRSSPDTLAILVT